VTATRRLTVLVVLVALHSLAVGFFLTFVTTWGVAFGGWTDVHPLFFPRQAGVFHFVVAAGYLIEYFRYRGVLLMVTAKCIAVVFLVDATWRYGGPWAVPVSAVGDAAMAVVVLFAFWRAKRTGGPEGPPHGRGEAGGPEGPPHGRGEAGGPDGPPHGLA
jgi:hypothetical protein